MTDDIEDHRDELAKANARLREQMKAQGYAFQIAEGNERHPPYVYTTGLASRFGHPEIYVVGLPAQTAASMIEEIISRIRAGERFDRPCFVDNIIEYEMPIMPIAADAGILAEGGAVQLFFTDPAGYAPWEPECDPEFGDPQTSLFGTAGPYPSRRTPLERRERSSRARPSDAEIQRRMRDGVQMLREQVRKNGFTFQPVFPAVGDEGEPFVYTIGLSTTYNHPELYVVGLDAGDAIQVMLRAIDKISDGESFETPTFFEDEDGDVFPVRPLVQVDVDEKSGLGQQVLGHGFAAVQVYYPDENGLFPWEAGCDPNYATQLDELRPVGEPPNLPDSQRANTVH
jgi:hypothetical protein